MEETSAVFCCLEELNIIHYRHISSKCYSIYVCGDVCEGKGVPAMEAIDVSCPPQRNKPRLPGHGSEQAEKPF